MSQPNNPRTVVAVTTKSVGIALILTFILGPIGMFYSTILGAIIMLVAAGLAFLVTLPLGGWGPLLLWPVYMVWGAVAAHMHNKRVLSRAQ